VRGYARGGHPKTDSSVKVDGPRHRDRLVSPEILRCKAYARRPAFLCLHGSPSLSCRTVLRPKTKRLLAASLRASKRGLGRFAVKIARAMNAKKNGAVGLVLTVVFSVALIYRDSLVIARLRSSLSTEQKANDRRFLELEKEYKASMVAGEEARNALNGLQRATGASAGFKSLAPPASVNDMRKDPKYAAVWRRDQKRKLWLTYQNVWSSLGYSLQQVDKVLNTLVDREEAAMDAKEAASAAGLSPQEISQALAEAVNSYNEKLKSTLGTAGYAGIEDAPQITQFNAWFDSAVGVDLQASGTPATAQQESSLAQTYVDFRKGGIGATADPNAPPDPQSGLNPYFAALLNSFASELTPAQAQIMRDYFVDQVTANQYWVKLHPSQ